MSWNPIKAVKKLHKAMPGVGSSDPKKAFINLHNAMPGTKEYIGELDSKGNIVEQGAYDPFVGLNTEMTYQQPFGYQLAQMPQYQAQQLPQTQGTDYNPMFAQMIRQMQVQPQQQMQPRSGGYGNYLFGHSFIQQPQYQQQMPQQQYQQQYGQRYQQSPNQQMPQFDYTQAMMGRRFF